MAGRPRLSESDLFALGWAVGVAAVEAARKAARAEAEAVFEAITEAGEAASHYLSAQAQSPEVGSAAAAEAYEAVQRAAARVSSRVVVLIGRLYVGAGDWAKTKLEDVNGLVHPGDVASVAAAIVHGIQGFSPSTKFPSHSSRQFLLRESPTASRAESSTKQIVELLGLTSSAGAAGEMALGSKVPTEAKVAISVIGVAAELAFAVLRA